MKMIQNNLAKIDAEWKN